MQKQEKKTQKSNSGFLGFLRRLKVRQKFKRVRPDKKNPTQEPILRSPNSIQDTIDIKRISKSGIFELEKIEKNRKVKIFDRAYLFMDCNYATKDEKEQEDTFISYCKFLNSMGLKFKIILANLNRSTKVAEEVMLTIQNDGYDDYREIFNNIISERMKEGNKNIEQKKYIVVGAPKNDYETAKSFFYMLDNNMKKSFQNMESGLIPLDAVERLRLVHSIYNIGKEDLFNFEWDSAVEIARDWKNDICASYIDHRPPTHMQINEKYCRGLFIKSYPSNLSDEFLTKLMSVPFHIVTAIDVEPVPKNETLKILTDMYLNIEKSITKQQEQRNKNGQFSTDISYEKRKEKEEIEEMMNDVRNNDQKMFKTGFSIMIYADSLEELNLHTDTIKSLGEGESLTIDVHWLNQLETFKTCLPIAGSYVKTKRSLFTQSLAVLMPFNVQEIFDIEGLFYGINQISKNCIIGNRKALSNGNGFYFGASGTGKSLNAKLELMQVLLNTQDDVIVIDPQNEYKKIARALNGAWIEFAANTKNYVNPFRVDMELNEENKQDFIGRKVEFILGICEQAAHGNLDQRARSLIDRCVKKLYEDIGCGKEKEKTMLDFYRILTANDGVVIREEDGAGIRELAQDLALYLEIFVTGSLNIYAHETNVDNDNRLIVYGTKNLGKNLRALSILVMMEGIRDRIAKNAKIGRATWVYIDEIHELTKSTFASLYLESFWKEVRKEGGLCTGITQNVSDVLINKVTENMLSNSEFVCLLKQAPSDQEKLLEVLKISKAQMKYVSDSPDGTGLIKFGEKVVPSDSVIPKDDKLYPLVNTDPGRAA